MVNLLESLSAQVLLAVLDLGLLGRGSPDYRWLRSVIVGQEFLKTLELGDSGLQCVNLLLHLTLHSFVTVDYFLE